MSLSIIEPTMINTTEIDTLAEEVSALSMRCGLLSSEASAARTITAPPQSSARWSTAGPRIEEAADELAHTADKTAALARSLGVASSLYIDAETTVNGLFDTAASVAGAVGGSLFSHMLIPLVGATIALAPTAVAAGYLISRNPGVQSAVRRVTATLGDNIATWLRKHPEAARNPLTMLLVRGLVEGSDDALRGSLGIPPNLAVGMEDSTINIPTLAFGLGALGVAGLGESTVRVTRTGSSSVAPPDSITDLAKRIPDASPGKPQIRIEKYGPPGDESWAVYVSGTVDMSMADTTEAFDFESDVALMADADGGGYRAVVEAMRDAGISPDDPVTVVGHSQGGLIAERVAQSQEYDVTTVVTFGSPTTDAELPDGVTAYAVEHRDDIVPALGGFSTGGERVVVAADSSGQGDDWLSAHAMTEYEQTAESMDASDDPRMDPLKDAVAEFGSDEGTSTTYHATRPTDQAQPVAGDSPSSAEPDDGTSGRRPAARPQDAELNAPKLDREAAPGGADDSSARSLTEESSGQGHQIDPNVVDDDLLRRGPEGRHGIGRLGPLPSPLPLPDEVRLSDPAH